jgi:hypothetical protein
MAATDREWSGDSDRMVTSVRAGIVIQDAGGVRMGRSGFNGNHGTSKEKPPHLAAFRF